MLGHNRFTEQRQKKRYILNDQSYAILKQQNYSEVAQLLDISRSGISFLCLNEGDWEDEPFFIDLTRADEALSDPIENDCLSNIPLHPLSYCTESFSHHHPNDTMQRCGVRFGQLTLEQKIKLNDFIEKYAIDCS